MYQRSGIIGAISIVASFLFVAELAGCPTTGGPEGTGRNFGRMLFFAAVAVTCGVASMTLHRKSERDGSRPKSGRTLFAEGIVMTLLGLVLLLGGFVWLQLSGGAFGLHFAGFVLGGYLALKGFQRLNTGE